MLYSAYVEPYSNPTQISHSELANTKNRKRYDVFCAHNKRSIIVVIAAAIERNSSVNAHESVNVSDRSERRIQVRFHFVPLECCRIVINSTCEPDRIAFNCCCCCRRCFHRQHTAQYTVHNTNTDAILHSHSQFSKVGLLAAYTGRRDAYT